MNRRLKLPRMPRLPILSKDLLERASRKRTYVIRFLYGLALFVAACTLFYGNIGVSAEAGEALGRGAAHFRWLLGFQLVALYVLVPIITAEAIAGEKQRDTLALLLVTTLTPRQIILQKFVARMASVLSFVCLSFPLLAITYTFGGVTPAELVDGMILLVIVCLHLGAVAIACSAYFQTTAQALAATYIASISFRFCCFGGMGSPSGPGNVVGSILALISIFVCLMMAGQFLVDRAFVQSRNYLLECFRALDRVFEQMNVVTGGVVLVRDRGFLPRNAPIRWRETRKKSLGTFRYLFRVLALLETPIIYYVQLVRLTPGSRVGDYGLTKLLYGLWLVAAPLVAVHAASVISEERSRQTLSVLLTTPLSSMRILEEKLSGVRRLSAVLMVPFASIFLFVLWWNSRPSIDYLVLSALTVMTYLTLIQWTSLAIGLRFPNQLTAIVGAAGLLGLWVGGLQAGAPLLNYLNIDARGLAEACRALSPIDMITRTQSSAETGLGPKWPSPWEASRLATIAHFSFYVALGLVIQLWCRLNADRYLGRIPQPGSPAIRWLPWTSRDSSDVVPAGLDLNPEHG
jgi:ABC-type transport system involved in multi-copper enzyme maturation permease subunit